MQNLSFDHIIGIRAGSAFANLASKENRPRRRRERRRAPQYSTIATDPSRVPSNYNGSLPPSHTSTFSHIQIVNKEDLMETKPHSSPQPTFTKPSLEYETAQQDSSPFTSGRPPSTDTLANNIQGATFAAKARAAELQAARSRRELKSRTDHGVPSTHETMTFKSKSKGKTWKPLDLSDLPGRSGDESEDPSLHYIQSDLPESSQGDGSQSSEDLTTLELTRAASGSEQPLHDVKDANKLGTEAADAIPAPKIREFKFQTYTDAQWETWNTEDGRGGLAEVTQKMGLYNETNAENLAAYERFKEERDKGQAASLESIAKPSGTSNYNQASEMTRWQKDQLRDELQADYDEACAETKKQTAEVPEYSRVHDEMNKHRDELAELQNRLLVQIPTRPSGNMSTKMIVHPTPIRPKPLKRYPAVKGTMNPGFRFPPPGIPLPMTQSSIGTKGSHKSSVEAEKDILLQKLHDVAQSVSSQGFESSTRADRERPIPVISDPAIISNQFPQQRDYLMPKDSPYHRSSNDIDVFDVGKSSSDDAMRLVPLRPGSTASANWNRPENEQATNIDKWWHQDNRMSRSLKVYMEEIATAARAALKNRAVSDQAALRLANFSDNNEPFLGTSTASGETDESSGQVARDLLFPVLGNLRSYSIRRDYFNMTYGDAPQWCIEHGPTGNQSFFGGDWGTPPPRVGRDPRYRPAAYDERDTRYRSSPHDEIDTSYYRPIPRWNVWG